MRWQLTKFQRETIEHEKWWIMEKWLSICSPLGKSAEVRWRVFKAFWTEEKKNKKGKNQI